MDSSGQRFSTHDNFLTIFGVSTKFDNLKQVNCLISNVLLSVAVVIVAWIVQDSLYRILKDKETFVSRM